MPLPNITLGSVDYSTNFHSSLQHDKGKVPPEKGNVAWLKLFATTEQDWCIQADITARWELGMGQKLYSTQSSEKQHPGTDTRGEPAAPVSMANPSLGC